MDILAQLQALVSLINELQAKLVDAEAALSESAKIAYDKGFADGAASVVVTPPTDKLYSEEELQTKIKEALFPLEEKLLPLKQRLPCFLRKLKKVLPLLKLNYLLNIMNFKLQKLRQKLGSRNY